MVPPHRTAARRSAAHRRSSQRIAFAFAAHRIRRAVVRRLCDYRLRRRRRRRQGDGVRPRPRPAGCSVSPCVAMCRPVLQRVALCCSVARSAWHRAVTTVPCAPLSVPRALWRRARGSDHVGQGVKTACRTAAAAMPADAVRHAHCAATITYMCVLVSVLQRRGNPHVAVVRLAA